MKPSIGVCDVDKLIKVIDEEKAKIALHCAASEIREAMYKAETMKAAYVHTDSNIMYFVGKQSGLDEALCRIYVALKECLQEEA